uniref:Uncharacterized protein n=1 Tax=Oryza nivara TaxID=4536 RepID=A0A0E0J1L2_ORYNI
MPLLVSTPQFAAGGDRRRGGSGGRPSARSGGRGGSGSGGGPRATSAGSRLPDPATSPTASPPIAYLLLHPIFGCLYRLGSNRIRQLLAPLSVLTSAVFVVPIGKTDIFVVFLTGTSNPIWDSVLCQFLFRWLTKVY